MSEQWRSQYVKLEGAPEVVGIGDSIAYSLALSRICLV